MREFKVGDTVQVQEGDVMKGTVGTIISWDDARAKWLVRVADIQQTWVRAEHLKLLTVRPQQ